MKLVSMRLVSGEEVIAQVQSTTHNGLNLYKARQLQVMDMGNGKAGAAFVPLLLLADDTKHVFVPEAGYIAYTETINPEYERRYLETVSGIQLASTLKG